MIQQPPQLGGGKIGICCQTGTPADQVAAGFPQPICLIGGAAITPAILDSAEELLLQAEQAK